MTVKKASTRQMILKSEVNGVITSIPWNRVACCGRRSTAPMASAIPKTAAAEAGPALLVLASPTTRTTNAVSATIASGDASFRRSR
jgi:hypothetical protein